MTIWPNSIKQSDSLRWLPAASRELSLLLVLGITIGIIMARDQIESIGAYGYPAIFAVSLISNAAFLLPAPAIALVLAAGGTHDPIAVGVVAGLGATIGEMTGYLVGQSSQSILEDRPLYWRIEKLMRRSGTVVIFVLAAVPNPLFDVGALVAGALRMPVWRFLLGAWFGKSLRFALLAAFGAASL